MALAGFNQFKWKKFSILRQFFYFEAICFRIWPQFMLIGYDLLDLSRLSIDLRRVPFNLCMTLIYIYEI